MMFTKDLVRLVKVRKFTKDDRELCFLTVADPATFESCELMPVRDLDVSKLKEGTDYKAFLHLEGRYTNIDLFPKA